MTSHTPPGDAFDMPGLWPTADQLLLLKAGLLGKDEACEAMQLWLDEADRSNGLDGASVRLLSLAYSNLQQFGFQAPLMNRLAATHRASRLKAASLFHDAEKLAAALSDAGIPVMVLKGLHLAQEYYPDPAARPMNDLDLAVPKAHAEAANRVLEGLGYSRDFADEAFEKCVRYQHALPYVSDKGADLDLHFRVLLLRDDPTCDDVFWQQSVPFRLGNTPVVAMNPTHLLFHTVVHGICWNPMPPLRWIADAMMVLRKSGNEIDWNEIGDLAESRQVTHRARLGLQYLKASFHAPVPEGLIERLKTCPESLVERVENACIIYNTEQDDVLGIYRRWFGEHTRRFSGRNPVRFLYEFADYLRFRTEQVHTFAGLAGFVALGVFKYVGRKAGFPAERAS
ncbi:MAG TPA: nucleotidyltransferase family protein [Hyphomonas sp.]|nr:nucleotidyltransferase family protein [Hyphomonas sp.]